MSGPGKTLETITPEVVDRVWKRDFAVWSSDPAALEIIGKSTGWLDLPAEMKIHSGRLADFADEIRAAGFKNVVLLGMGGSSLAPEVFWRVFGPRPGYPALRMLDSTDPEAVVRTARECYPGETLYLVASKSGTTTEPLRLFDYFWAKAELDLGDSAGDHFIAITDPGSKLLATAKEKKFRRVFENFPDIGGRFSALSFFGLVPAALIGVDLEALLWRAGDLSEACKFPVREQNPGWALAADLAAAAAAGRDKIILQLPSELESLALWLEQLVAESLGKNGVGIVPIAGVSAAEADGSDRHVVKVRLADKLDLGAEMFRWEFATALLGKVLGVNPFDQPDVESAKVQTRDILAAVAETGSLPEVQAHAKGEGYTLTFSKDAAARDLNSLIASAGEGEYLGLLAFLTPLGEYEAVCQRLRAALAAKTGLPVQFGYGPRYLHSTGQLHKGGPDNGVFLVIAPAAGHNDTIPGAGYTFGQLLEAQGLGDFRALEAAGRRAVFVRLSGERGPALEALAEALER